MDRDKLTILLVIGVLVFIFFGGENAKTGVAVGFAGALSMWLTYQALPRFLQRIIIHLHLVVDLLIGYLIFNLMSEHKTATAIIAAVSTELAITFLLKSEKRRIAHAKLERARRSLGIPTG